MNHLANLLQWFRINESNDFKVSLTNSALLIVLLKILVAPTLAMADVGALFVTLLAYQSKKFLGEKNRKMEDARVEELKAQSQALEVQLEELRSVVSGLGMKIGLAPKR